MAFRCSHATMLKGDVMAKKSNGHMSEAESIVRAIEKLGADLGARIDKVNSRLDQIIDNTGARWREHEGRLAAIERKLKIAK